LVVAVEAATRSEVLAQLLARAMQADFHGVEAEEASQRLRMG